MEQNIQHGFSYQLKLILLFLHRVFISGKSAEPSQQSETYDEFRFYTELAEAEKFDDVVLQYRQCEGPWKLRLFQAKHSEKKDKSISIKDLYATKSNDPFNMSKYFTSFLRIREKCKSNSSSSLFEGCDIKDLNIITNIEIEEETKKRYFTNVAGEVDFLISGPQNINHQTIEIFKFKNVNSEAIDKFKTKFENESDFNRLINSVKKWVLSEIVQPKGKYPKFEPSSDEMINYYMYPLVRNVFETSDDQWLCFKNEFLIDDVYQDFRTNLMNDIKVECPKIDIKNLKFNPGKKILDKLKCLDEVNIEEPEKFALQFNNIIKTYLTTTEITINDNSIALIEVEEQRQFLSNIKKISGYVVTKRKNKLRFNTQFLKMENLLPGNINSFREHLILHLGGGVFNQLHQYEIKMDINEFQPNNEEYFNRKLPSQINEDDLREFFEKFKIIKFANRHTVQDLINLELGEQWGTLKGELINSYYTQQMYDWMVESITTCHTKDTVAQLFTDCDIMLNYIYLKGITQSYFMDVYPSNVKFEIDTTFEDFFNGIQQIGHYEVEDFKYGRSKIFQHLQNMHGDDDTGYACFQSASINETDCLNKVIGCFRSPKWCNLLVIECADRELTYMKTIFPKMEEILRNNGRKKILIVSQSCWDKTSLQIHDSNKIVKKIVNENPNILFSIVKDSRIKILESKLLFQGRSMKASEIFHDETSQSVIDQSLITKLIDREPIILDLKIQDSQGYKRELYIDRNFVDINDVENTTLPEMDLLKDNTKKLILISNVAGMGKTTLLTSLINKLKEMKPSTWCLRINLNDYLEAFEKLKNGFEINTEFILDHFMNPEMSKLDKNLWIIALNHKNVQIFVDGFDEISPNFDNDVVKLITYLSNFTHKIFVTSRPHRREHLEKELQEILHTYEMKQLDEDSQKRFLQKCWQLNWETNHEESETYCTEILQELSTQNEILYKGNTLTGNPLHLEMIATTFSSKSDVEKFLESSDESFTILKLYDQFIKRKYQIYTKDKLKLGTVGALNLVEKKIFWDNHKKAALTLVFDYQDIKTHLISTGDWEKFNSDLKLFMENVRNFKDRCGLIVHVYGRDRPLFVHRTFVEYFVAEFIIDLFQNPETRNATLKFLIEKFYNQNMTYNIQKFLNFKLTKEFCQKLSHTKQRINFDSFKEFMKKILVVSRWLIKENHPNLYRFLLEMLQNNQLIMEEILYDMFLNIYDYSDDIIHIFVNTFGEFSLFHFACTKNYSEFIMNGICILMEKNLEFSTKSNPFLRALLSRRFEMAKKLTMSNISLDDINAMFHYFVALNDKETVECLMNCGIDINYCNKNGHNALHLAMENNSYKMADFLVLKNEALLLNVELEAITSFFHHSVAMNIKKTVIWLLKYGVDVNCRNRNEQTALHHAMENKLFDMAKILVIRNGASPSYVESEVKTAFFHHSVVMEKKATVKWMITRVIDVNCRNKNGQTALHLAIENNLYEMAKFLVLENGASVDIKDSDGRPPLAYLIHYNNKINFRIIELCIKNGMKQNDTDVVMNLILQKTLELNYLEELIKYIITNKIDININFELLMDPQIKDNISYILSYIRSYNGITDRLECIIDRLIKFDTILSHQIFLISVETDSKDIVSAFIRDKTKTNTLKDYDDSAIFVSNSIPQKKVKPLSGETDIKIVPLALLRNNTKRYLLKDHDDSAMTMPNSKHQETVEPAVVRNEFKKTSFPKIKNFFSKFFTRDGNV